MARKLKHSKIKNTGILFELLTRQITADVLAGKSTRSVSIVKKYFNENTELGKELQLYRILSEKHYESESRASHLLDAVIKSRQGLSNTSLRREKYNLIKEIKESYNVNDFFNGRIPNYRVLASIYNVFQSETTDDVFDPESSVSSKFTVLEHITSKKVSDKEIKEKVLKEYTKKDKDLRLNTNSLRDFVDDEAMKIKKELKTHVPKVKDEITKIKLTEAVKQIGNLTKGKVVDEKQVLTLMRYYELVKEIENVHKT